MLNLDGITITWLGHDTTKIKGDKVIYIDPFQLKGGEIGRASCRERV